MTVKTASPSVQPSGLVTVAYLKAKIDQGEDHLGIFLPLVLDVVPDLANKNFTAGELGDALLAKHGIRMPQPTIQTLLKRVSRQGVLIRKAGRYSLDGELESARDLEKQKKVIADAQNRLGSALVEFAEQRDLLLNNGESALRLLLRFLKSKQVSVLLEIPSSQELSSSADIQTLSQKEINVLNEFVRDIVPFNDVFKSTLGGILKGLVLYEATFLPDFAGIGRQFQNMRVYFDSGLVLQALGYQGASAKKLATETTRLLKSAGIHCLVFDDTVREVRQILSACEHQLSLPHVHRNLRPSPIIRHFLSERYSPGDIRQVTILLEDNIRSLGFVIASTPTRTSRYTADEAALSHRLLDPKANNPDEPRIIHDINCIAGILTLRQERRIYKVEEANALFMTNSSLMIKNTNLWWTIDEGNDSISPVIHVCSLVNLVWLKNPEYNTDLQLQELLVLCEASMQPAQKIWERFLSHLESLEKDEAFTEAQSTAIVSAVITENLLGDVDVESDDLVDAETFDEVIDRAKEELGSETTKKILDLEQHHAQEISSREEDFARVQDKSEKQQSLINSAQVKTKNLVDRFCSYLFWIALILVLAGTLYLFFIVLPVSWVSWVGGFLLIAVLLIVSILDGMNRIQQLKDFREKLSISLSSRLNRWLFEKRD
ncbi:MAG: hypothetical protein FWE48_06865 [Coriobacteriia bacterium]|nr:hypothetical protein [Coriobacteriia bacterium]MCL2871279.1 hypothetical protein [Coriobacteriia bacterium]